MPMKDSSAVLLKAELGRRDDTTSPRCAKDPSEAKTAHSHFIEPEMFEPVSRPGSEGLVPLCAALHWIMTKCGTIRVALDDPDGWNDACERLFPFIQSGEIALVGRPRGGALAEQIPGYALAAIKVLPPLPVPLSDVFRHSPSHIRTSTYGGRENRVQHFSDELYRTGQPGPAWTHLQIPKSEILERWPRPTPRAATQLACERWLQGKILKSPGIRTKSKEAFFEEAKGRYPKIGTRQFKRAWEAAVTEPHASAWTRHGPIPKSDQNTA